MIYHEQKPEVTIEPDDAEPVRVTFADVTLCMNLIDASWLSAMVGKAIRDCDRAAREKAVTVPVEQKRKLPVGSRVLVRDDGGYEAIYEVKASPWQLGHG